MRHPHPAADLDPIEVLILTAIVTAEALIVLIAATAALVLALAGKQRTKAPPAVAKALPPAPALVAPAVTQAPNRATPTPADPLAELKVADLRRLARAAGHRKLAHSGRRDQLLAALQTA